jgi:hypothetical protein
MTFQRLLPHCPTMTTERFQYLSYAPLDATSFPEKMGGMVIILPIR